MSASIFCSIFKHRICYAKWVSTTLLLNATKLNRRINSNKNNSLEISFFYSFFTSSSTLNCDVNFINCIHSGHNIWIIFNWRFQVHQSEYHIKSDVAVVNNKFESLFILQKLAYLKEKCDLLISRLNCMYDVRTAHKLPLCCSIRAIIALHVVFL